MRRGGGPARAAALLALAACGPSLPPAPPVPTPGDFFVAGYHPWWTGDRWEAYPHGLLDQLFFFEVELAPDGSVSNPRGWPAEWEALRSRALGERLPLVPTLTLHGSGAFQALFTDRASWNRAVESVLGLLDDPLVRGLHLDIELFEPVSPAAREGYTAFVAELSRRMDARDPALGLSLFALAFDDADVFDEAALAPLVDYLVVQGYDLHSQGEGRAGPLAALEGWDGLNWPAVLARYDALGIPRGKLVMGVPLYGYEWPTETAEAGSATQGVGVGVPLVAPPGLLPELPRAWEQAERHGLQRDPVSGTPWYAYRDPAGTWVQGWFEDRESLLAKYRFVRREGLAGVAFFPLAYGDPRVWEDLRRFLGGEMGPGVP